MGLEDNNLDGNDCASTFWDASDWNNTGWRSVIEAIGERMKKNVRKRRKMRSKTLAYNAFQSCWELKSDTNRNNRKYNNEDKEWKMKYKMQDIVQAPIANNTSVQAIVSDHYQL